MFINNAMAAAGPATGSAGQGGFGSLIMLAVFGLIFYFLLFRPQSKRQKEHKTMISAIEKGDEVVTNGGLIGKVIKLDDNLLMLKVSDNTEVMVQRGMVASTLPKGTIKSLK